MDKEHLFRHLERDYYSKDEIMPYLPLGLDSDEIWEEIKQCRREKGIILPLSNWNNEPYWYTLTESMITSSEIIVSQLLEEEGAKNTPRHSIITIEEMYYTGFLEGVQLSMQDAMEYLQSSDEPSSVEELILINSRQASAFAAENRYHAIDRNYLHNLAYFLTEGLDNGGGDFRMTDHLEIPFMKGEVIRFPPADTLPSLVDEFVAFLANVQIHPLIKAAAAQAWILITRPFPEGNERLARLLSNVILTRAGYHFFGEVSISAVTARSSFDYFRAIANTLRTENGGDMTYFLNYYLKSLSETVHELRERREQKTMDAVKAEQQMAEQPLEAGSGQGFSSDCELVVKALHELKKQGVSRYTTMDISELTGFNRKKASRFLLYLEKAHQVTVLKKSNAGNVYGFPDTVKQETETTIAEQNFVDVEESIQPNLKYEKDVLHLIAALADSSASTKDKRIGSMLRACLDQGRITRDTYDTANKGNCWTTDMRFAVQMGLVRKIDEDTFEILTQVNPEMILYKSQKATLKAIYDVFGEDSFSVEMLVANLDYSSSHISGMLHQFRWMKLVDCTVNPDHSHTYQLNVNPINHPECFGEAA